MGAAENDELKRVLGPTADCPVMERLLDGKLNAQEQAHVSHCGYCKAELALYQSFEEAAPRPDEAASVQWIASRLKSKGVPTPQRAVRAAPWWKTWQSMRTLVPASLALASVLLAIGIVQFSRRAETPAGIHVTPGDTMRSQTLDVIGPAGEIPKAPSGLRWITVAGAAKYSVRVMEVDRTVLWETSVPATSVALPESVLSRIVPHKRLLWEVTAFNSQGIALAASGTKDFVLITK